MDPTAPLTLATLALLYIVPGLTGALLASMLGEMPERGPERWVGLPLLGFIVWLPILAAASFA